MVLYFGGYLGLKGFQISSEKKRKEKKASSKRVGRDILNTGAKFQTLISQK